MIRRVAALTAAAAALTPAVADSEPIEPASPARADLGDELGGPHRDAIRVTAAERRRARWRRVVRPYAAWLASVRACESDTSGGYRAVSPDGLYTGAYQFDDQTWRSVGGRGRAGDAAPLEQDLRAVLLLRRRGTGPWPRCG